METVIVLLILALSEKNAELKETLKSVLEFYRQNRDLLTALAGVSKRDAPEPTEKKEAQKNSPAGEGESLRLIEEFLKRQTL